MKKLGLLIMIFGAIDLIGIWFFDYDLWVSVNLPEIIWEYTFYIELGVGYWLFTLGSNNKKERVSKP